jgi:hypothetical protein
MKLPDVKLVKFWLEQGNKKNSGPWIKHSETVANAAKIIAGHIRFLNKEQAYIMGLIHDIGRIVGKTKERHTIDGFIFLKRKGYKDLARICITHCFPNKNINANISLWDCDNAELEFVEKFLLICEYNDYDRLIQLCDCISMEDRYVLIEKRLIDVALRYNLMDKVPLSVPILEKWQKYLNIKKYFDKLIGKSIYDLLPNVIESTFDSNPQS